MSKIIIEDGLSVSQNKGVGQYTLGMYEILKSLNFDVIMDRKIFLEKIQNAIIRRIFYLIWLNTVFILKLLFTKNVEYILYTSTLVPIIKLPHIKYISVLHDILSTVHPECRTPIQNFHANLATLSATKFADKIITVSNFSKQEIIKYFKVTPQLISVVNSSYSTNLPDEKSAKQNILKDLGLKHKSYILSVATTNKHKNTQVLIEAFYKIADIYPDIKLVLVGQTGNYNLNINHKNIIFTGFVTNENLVELYKNALIYAFPSLYEGFGTPNVDAQRFKLPVICSDIPVFREICKNNSAYFSAPTVKGFSEGLKELLNSEELRISLINKGIENYKLYSLENIKEQLKEALLNI